MVLHQLCIIISIIIIIDDFTQLFASFLNGMSFKKLQTSL